MTPTLDMRAHVLADGNPKRAEQIQAEREYRRREQQVRENRHRLYEQDMELYVSLKVEALKRGESPASVTPPPMHYYR